MRTPLLLAVALLAAQDRSSEPRPLDIRPAEKGWEADGENVRRVLRAAAGELWRYFPDRDLKPILVEAQGGPITLAARGARGEYQVRLATGGTLWAQYTFQFAHEFCHILCNYDEDPSRCKWFEEAICEVASLFVLRRSGETWKARPPYPNWKEYAKSLAEYADGRIKAAPLPAGKTLAEWYKENADALAATAVDRERNTIAAVQLLPFLEKAPEHWEAVTWLNTEKLTPSHTLPEYLRAWRSNAPEKHRGFITDLAKALGVDLK